MVSALDAVRTGMPALKLTLFGLCFPRAVEPKLFNIVSGVIFFLSSYWGWLHWLRPYILINYNYITEAVHTLHR